MGGWTCPNCHESVDGDYDVCWSCGTDREGSTDPAFVTADDAGPIYDPLVDRRPDSVPEALEELPEPMPELVQCYSSTNPTESHFVAQELRGQGVPALTRRSTGVYTWNEDVLIRAQDQQRAAAWLAEWRTRRRDTSREGR